MVPINRYFIFFAVALMNFAGSLDISIVNLGLPAIAQSLNTSLTGVQWIITIYLLAAASLMIPAGSIGDIITHKYALLLGTFIFMISTLAIGFADSVLVITIERFIQGIGFAFSLPMSMTIAKNLFADKYKGLIIGLMSSISGLSIAIGPVLGGIVLHYLNWSWLFWLNVPICLFSFILAALLIPKGTIKLHKIDYVGILLLTVSLILLITLFNQLNHWGFNSAIFWVLLMLVILFLGCFYWYELRQIHPILDLKILKEDHIFTIICIMRFCTQGIVYIFLFILGIYLINISSFSSIAAGNILLTMTLVYGVLSMFAGGLADRYGVFWLILVGLFCLLVGCLWFGFMGVSQKLWLLIPPLVFVGLNMATGANMTTLAIHALPEDRLGSGTGVYYTLGFLGSAVFIALTGVVITGISAQYIVNSIVTQHWMLTAIQQHQLLLAAHGARPLNSLIDVFGARANIFLILASNAFLYAFHWVMWVASFLIVINIGLLFIIKRYLARH